MKNLHCSGAGWSWSSSSTHRRRSSIPDHRQSNGTLQYSTAYSYKITLSHTFLEDFIAEAVIQVAEPLF